MEPAAQRAASASVDHTLPPETAGHDICLSAPKQRNGGIRSCSSELKALQNPHFSTGKLNAFPNCSISCLR